ncbi:hypothetical protein G6011_03521 [Alternaria panax]|uniref:RING-type domain-containing protein n=1 Tax=Alternaria panax TaxID=48097 RepID=A0AAD4IFI6_9PLEO|nr:hypothetical protein G6011_03521 [Alternaria panax]
MLDDDEFNFQGHGNHTRNNPTRVLEEAMSNLDHRLGGARQGRGMGMSFGPDSPFNQGGHSHVPDISGLHISGSDDAFISHPIFAGRRFTSQPEFMLDSFVPVRRPSSGGAPSQHHIERIIHQGSQPGDYLSFYDLQPQSPEDTYSLGSVPYDYLPIEFEPVPLAEDSERTESGEQRVNRFVAQHTEPLTTANTTSTTNTDCPICMENATAHACVKIKAIAGCEHMIGQDCLKELLNRQTDNKKTCPLCRAVWLRESGVWQGAMVQWDRPIGRGLQSTFGNQGAVFSHGGRSRQERGMERVRGLLRSARDQQRMRHN